MSLRFRSEFIACFIIAAWIALAAQCSSPSNSKLKALESSNRELRRIITQMERERQVQSQPNPSHE